MSQLNMIEVPAFSRYQKFVIFILSITQFTVILDFMIMSPLGDIMMKSMDLTPQKFGWAVSAYAFSAGISGILAAGFADKYDRKKLLLFFYWGFIGGTIFCGLAHTYPALIAARIITGLFGGVIGSISMAIIADLFLLEQRGRVMGFAQMGFGASQVLGVPIGLYLAYHMGWEAPFLMVALLAIIIAVVIGLKLQPVNKHLLLKTERNAFAHLLHTIKRKDYRIGFTATALLSIGGFMMMPFGSAFAINNLKILQNELMIMFMVAGIAALLIMPFIGKIADKVDKFVLFAVASLWMVVMALVYTQLGPTPLWLVIVINILMMMGIMSRMVPSSALTSAVPDMPDRGAFMSINSSLQQIAGGIAAAIAGLIVIQPSKESPLQHYDTVGYVVTVITIISILLLYRVSNMVKNKAAKSAAKTEEPMVISEV